MRKYYFSGLLLLFFISASLFGYFSWKVSQKALIKISWTTATEYETVGFNIYRSEQIDYGFIKINEKIIPASQEPITGSLYSYNDSAVIPGRTYYYLLEEIDVSGLPTRNGPIEVRAQADYWLFLSLALLFLGIVILMLINHKYRSKVMESLKVS